MVPDQHLLDLGRVDVEARDDDQVLGPVDEVELARRRRRRRCRRCAASRRSVSTARPWPRVVPVPGEHVGARTQISPGRRRATSSPSASTSAELDPGERHGRSTRAATGTPTTEEVTTGLRLGEAVALVDGDAEPLAGCARPPPPPRRRAHPRGPGARRAARRRARRARFDQAAHIAGAPAITVTRWSAMASSADAGSNRSTSTTVAPARAGCSPSTTLSPKMWNSGQHPEATSSGR